MHRDMVSCEDVYILLKVYFTYNKMCIAKNHAPTVYMVSKAAFLIDATQSYNVAFIFAASKVHINCKTKE